MVSLREWICGGLLKGCLDFISYISFDNGAISIIQPMSKDLDRIMLQAHFIHRILGCGYHLL